MPVKKYVLDGQAIQSLDSFYQVIGKVLPLPDYFGRNLDALADVLTTDLDGPCEILWEHATVSKQAMNTGLPENTHGPEARGPGTGGYQDCFSLEETRY